MTRIRELRIQRGIQQKELAAILGIPANTYNQWENGKRQPDYQSLSKIADYFGVTTDYLLGRDTSDYNDVKVALFGGDGEVTDEMWDEVKQFADYVKAKYLKEKK